MAREEVEPDAEQQPSRRRNRLFSAEERSFRMDRRSRDAAAALRSAVADVLPRFIGSYSDETLEEYIVVLICNGKHQYQARDDLEAFLGDDSESFVTWLWGFLSKQNVALVDSCSFRDRLDYDCENLNEKKNFRAAEDHLGDAQIVNSNISVSRQHQDIHNLDSTKGQNVTRGCIGSADVISPEGLGGRQCFWEDQHYKKGQNAAGCRSLSMIQYDAAGRNARILTQEEFLGGEHVGRNASTRCLPEAVGIDDERMPMSLKRRSVWDRLGKPITEDRGLVRTHAMPIQNGLHKKAKLMVSEHEQRYCVDSYAHHDIFDRANPRKFTNYHTEFNTGQAQEHAGRANKSRLIGRLSLDGGRVFHGDLDRNNIQEREVPSQKSSLSLPVKSSRSQSVSESTSAMKGLTASAPEPTCDVFRPAKGHAMTSIKSPPSTARRNSEAEVLLGDQNCSPAVSNTPSSVREDGSNCRNKPVKDEILDMKLKIKQMELDVLKLRSKQMQINIEKQGSLSLGPHANFEEDGDSRTVLVTNVHFAATKEALSTHFVKCGTMLNVNILTDAITGHPKGAAYITFADKDSIVKAISLSGTSFLTRVLTVMRKADAPPGLLASFQQTWSPVQPWIPAPFQKGTTPKQASRYHLQWKREQSALEKSPAS